jgi:dTDP-4-dehydrorhamnose reductase
MIKTVIIFGSNGMLGRYINKYLSKKTLLQIIPLTRQDFNISANNLSLLEEFLVSKNINSETCIINCIGLIPQKNKKNESYYMINTTFPLLLTRYCSKYKAKLIQPTTDCVFNGKKGMYNETDEHNEKSEYGLSKSLSETPMQTIIRCSIIGEEKETHFSFLEWVKNSNSEINGWNYYLWNGITCLEYAKIVHQIICDNLFWQGVRHIYSPEPKTKYQLANIIKDIYNLPIIVNKIEKDNEVVNKTLCSIYDTLFDIPSLEQQIRDLKEFSIQSFS